MLFLVCHSVPALSVAIWVCPLIKVTSCVTTRNPNFQHLAEDKKLNPNQWEVHLIESKFCEDTRPDPQLQKAKAQHSVLIASLNRQGYREVNLSRDPRWSYGDYLQRKYRQTTGRP